MVGTRHAAQAVRPPFPPVFVQGGGVVLAALLGLASTKFPSLMPFTALPALGGVFYSYFASQARIAQIEIEGGRFRSFEKERLRKEGRIVDAGIARYVQPGLQVTSGEVLVISLETKRAKLERILVATVERSAAPATSGGEGEVDFFVAGEAFDQLRKTLPLARERSERDALEVALAPYRNAGAVLRGILVPAFVLFGVITLVLLLTRIFPGETSEIAASVLVAIVAVGGIFFLGRRFSKAPPTVLLRIDPVQFSLGTEGTTNHVTVPLRELSTSRETYVFRSKYGSFRFPTLKLSFRERAIRITVWQDRADLQAPGAPEGKAPNYLVGEGDFVRLLDRLERGT